MQSISKSDEKYLIRFDDWRNSLTGHGTFRDKTEYTYYGLSTILSDDRLDDLYTTGEMVARICEAFPDQLFKKDFNIRIHVNDKLDQVLSDEIKNQLVDDLEIEDKLTESFIFENVFGGSGLFLGVDNEDNFVEPFDVESVKRLDYLNVMDKRDLNPLSFYRETQNKKYGKFESFNVTSNYSSEIVHESYFNLFTGLKVSSRMRDKLNGWGLSFIQRCYNPLRSYGVSFKSLDNLLADANQGVFKFKDLMTYIAGGDYSQIQGRLTAMDMQRSTARAVVVDAEKEDFERQNFSWQGIDKPYQIIMLRLSAITNIPIAILMGREPAGLNATGESDFNIFYDKVEIKQRKDVAPRLRYLVYILAKTRNKEPSSIQINFEPLIQMSLKDKTEAYLKVAQADKIYIDEGVLSDNEVSQTRFTKDGWNSDTIIDTDERDRITAAEKKMKEIENEGSSETDISGGGVLDALNGAQMKSIVDIVGLIGAQEGGISSNQAKGILKVAIPGISDKQVNGIVTK